MVILCGQNRALVSPGGNFNSRYQLVFIKKPQGKNLVATGVFNSCPKTFNRLFRKTFFYPHTTPIQLSMMHFSERNYNHR
jgi:hypothetical protein